MLLRLSPQRLIMLSGLLLIGFGLVAIASQVIYEFLHPPTVFPDGSVQSRVTQTLKLSPSQLLAETRFVGIELVAFGVMLQMVGFIGARPWARGYGDTTDATNKTQPKDQ